MIGYYLKALRPEQWSKNLVVFAGLFFAHEFTDKVLISQAAIAFVLFCLASSAIYLINDLIDIDRDRRHPQKSKRPIASGKIGKTGAMSVSIALMLISLIGSAVVLNEYFFTAVA